MLSGLRVLDWCDGSGQLAGRILADLGAEVFLLEPPGGDPGRARSPRVGVPATGLRWLVANAGKKSGLVDLESPGGRSLALDLARSSDVWLDTFPPGWREARGLSDEVLRASAPGLVVARITPFGATGPRSGLSAGDLGVVAMGGNAAMTGAPEGPPLRCSLPTSSFHAGPEAVVGILLALLEREQSGLGQCVDVSMQECQVTGLLSGPGQLALHGRQGGRTGARLGRTREIWAAKDGWISFGLRGGPARIPNLIATVDRMTRAGATPDWLVAFDWKAWDPMKVDDETLARVEEAFAAYFRERTMRELYDEALRHRILLAPCNDGREVLHHPQLRSRNLFASLPVKGAGAVEVPARFARWSGDGELGLRGPAPSPGAHQDELLQRASRAAALPLQPVGEGPSGEGARSAGGLLRELRVLELGSGAAGPVAMRYFCEQGARVVRLESRLRPDFLRFLQPDGAQGLDRSPMFALLNADKRSLALDMKKPEALALLERLVDWADVVSENFAPGVLERWGVSVGAWLARKPRLVVVRSCLFGQTGPQRSYPGFGGQGSAIAGFNHLTGDEGGEALGPYATITDSLSPRFVGAAIAAALWRVARGGKGGVLDLSQIETGVYCLSEMVARESAGAPPAERRGNRSEVAVPHGIFPCRPAQEDGEAWIALAVRSEAAWSRLVARMAAEGHGLATDLATLHSREARASREDEIEAALAVWTRVHDAETLASSLRSEGLEAVPVQDFAAVLSDPQLAHRGHFVSVPHAELGTVLCERPGYRLSRCPGAIRRAGPRLGEHAAEVLSEELGLSTSEIEALEAAEVLR